MDLSTNDHHVNHRRRSESQPQSQWMQLRHRRRRHNLSRRWNQWKVEQTDFLKSNPDESILGKLESQICVPCQEKLGAINYEAIQERVNQLDELLRDVNITSNFVETMNESMHQQFSSKCMCICTF
jgi:hypothetical protein